MKQTMVMCWVTATALAVVAAPLQALEEQRRAALQNLLTQDCGSCHGLTMKGGLGPALLPGDLAGKSDAVLVATILEGRPGTAMPPWKALLSREEAQWMVRQLRQGLGGVNEGPEEASDRGDEKGKGDDDE